MIKRILTEATGKNYDGLTKSSDSWTVQMKQAKPRTAQKEVVVVRRSGRVANMPAPVYKEVGSFYPFDIISNFWTY